MMTNSNFKTILGTGAVLISAWELPVEGAVPNFDQMIVFGDSLSDNGNMLVLNNGFFPNLPYFAPGRFSNGDVWVEYLATDLGLNVPQPSFEYLDLNPNSLPSPPDGINFAIGGARTGDDNVSPAPGAIGLEQQIDTYVDLLNDQPANSDALYVLWAGANDYLSYYYDTPVPAGSSTPILPTQSNQITETVNNLSTYLDTLALKGAEYILVPNLPDLGDIPLAEQKNAVEDLNAVTQLHNEQLNDAIDMLRVSYPETNFIEFDVNALFNEVQANPLAFGFSNVTDACTNTDLSSNTNALPVPLEICENPGPEEYVYWDNQHPTTEFHKLIAREAKQELASVPEPNALPGTIALGSLYLFNKFRKKSKKIKVG